MSDYRMFLNDERTVLVTIWLSPPVAHPKGGTFEAATGEMTVALRDDSTGVWGPPISVKEQP